MPKDDNTCVVRGCQDAVIVRKHMLCGAHYKRYLRTGTIGVTEIRKKRNLVPFLDLLAIDVRKRRRRKRRKAKEPAKMQAAMAVG